jgi:4-amino-4-deoxy-L-arabinose transferase-like glycosyltransferase
VLATEPAPAPAHRHRAWEALGIVALSLVLNLAGNDRTSLWDRDEPRYAECTREMRASGDWVRPRFNAEPRYQKPILIYWVMLAGTAIAGDNPFGARLGSSIAGAASCLVCFLMGSRMFGARIGRIAALILATAPIVVANSKLATTDACLALFVLGCQYALWTLSRKPSALAALAFWTCLAMATLVKGPVGPAMIAAAAVVSWACGGSSACWGRLRWKWGLTLFAILVAPWFVAIGILSRGDFFRVAVGSQLIQRLTVEMEQHGGFPGYYPASTILAFYPWSALLPAALVAGFVRRKKDPTLGFLLGWAIGPMILLECVRTKLVHYYLPAYPACALLVASLVAALADSEMNLRRWPLGRLANGLLLGVGLSLVIVALAGGIVLPWSLKGPSLAMAVILGFGTFFASESFRSGKAERAAFGLAGTWAAALAVLWAWMLPAAEPYRMSPRVSRTLDEIARREGARPMLAMFQEPSVVYALGAPIPVMRDRPWLLDILRKDRVAVVPVVPMEKAILQADPSIAITSAGFVSGFNLSKGRSETLEMILIRPGDPELARRSTLRR